MYSIYTYTRLRFETMIIIIMSPTYNCLNTAWFLNTLTFKNLKYINDSFSFAFINCCNSCTEHC